MRDYWERLSGSSTWPPSDIIKPPPSLDLSFVFMWGKLWGHPSGVSPYATRLTKQRKQQKQSYEKCPALASAQAFGPVEVLSVLVSNVNRVH